MIGMPSLEQLGGMCLVDIAPLRLSKKPCQRVENGCFHNAMLLTWMYGPHEPSLPGPKGETIRQCWQFPVMRLTYPRHNASRPTVNSVTILPKPQARIWSISKARIRIYGETDICDNLIAHSVGILYP